MVGSKSVSGSAGWLALVVPFTWLLACQGPAERRPTGPGSTPGWIRVSVATSGEDPDPDGYRVEVWEGTELVFGARLDDTVVADVPPGDYSIELRELTRNCTAEGGIERAVTVAQGDTTETAYDVRCLQVVVTLEVSAETSGNETDPDGYSVVLDGIESGMIGADGSISLTVHGVGEHTVELRGVAPQCEVCGSNPRTINVDHYREPSADFGISCVSGLSGKIAWAVSSVLPGSDWVPTWQAKMWVKAADCTCCGCEELLWFSGSLSAPEWSPDGTRIAFVSDRYGNEEIEVTGVGRVTENEASDGSPSWSPDGGRLAFASDRDGNFEIYVMNVDGTGVERLTDNDAYDGSPSWSPDGAKIAFASNRDGDFEIYVMNADGTGGVRLTDNEASDGSPDWSPDGAKLAFASDRDGDNEIYVMNADGTGVQRLTDNDVYDGSPSWSPDGTSIAFYQLVGLSTEAICLVTSDGTLLWDVTRGDAPNASLSKPTWGPGQV